MANGRFNRPVDSDLKFMASATLTPGGAGATADATGVNITSVSGGDENIDVVYNVSAAAGTIDATNYITVELQCSADDSTYYAVQGTTAKVTETGTIVGSFNSRELADLVADADYFRVTATQTGTTATAVTLEAYLTPGK